MNELLEWKLREDEKDSKTLAFACVFLISVLILLFLALLILP